MAEGNLSETLSDALDPQRFPALDLLLPALELRFRDPQTPEVLDLHRKKWILLTPEEWVRQHVLHWLLKKTLYPSGLLSIEKGIRKQAFRTDVLGYDRNGRPLLLVECKEARIPLGSETIFQAMKYNQSLKARFLWLTNGINHLVLELDEQGSLIRKHPNLPEFEEMQK